MASSSACMAVLLLSLVASASAVTRGNLGMYPDQTQAPPGISVEYEPARVTGGVNTYGTYNVLKKPTIPALPIVTDDIPLLYGVQNGTNLPEMVAIFPATRNGTYFWVRFSYPNNKTARASVQYRKVGAATWMTVGASGKRYSVYPGTNGSYVSYPILYALLGPLDYDSVYEYKPLKAAKTYTFKSYPTPGTPVKVSIIADVGQTWNSSDTYNSVLAADASLTIFVGDLNYADAYAPPCMAFTGTVTAGVKYCGEGGLRWDSWARLTEPLMAHIPTAFVPGNHELEIPALFIPPGEAPKAHVAYSARVPGFLPDATYPLNKIQPMAPFYYSVDIGMLHLISLSVYWPTTRYSPQWNWIQQDIATINRTKTPFVAVQFHNPIYHSDNVHYYEGESFRADYENFIYTAKADIVFAGHIHAYERSNPVYKNALDPCGPVHVTLGAGGNVEGIYAPFLVSTADGSHPVYSATQDYFFGHAELNIINATYAEYNWYRNVDNGTSFDFYPITPKPLLGC